MKNSRIVILAMSLLVIVLFSGCNNQASKLIGRWERMDFPETVMEFTDSKTVMDGAYQREYKIDGDKLLLNIIGVDVVFEYKIDGNILSLKKYGEEKFIDYIRADSLENDVEEVKKLTGQWESDQALVSFRDNGTLSDLTNLGTNTYDKGKYVASNGLIRFEPESGDTKFEYIKYEFVNEKLRISFLNTSRMESFVGGVGVSSLDLTKNITPKTIEKNANVISTVVVDRIPDIFIGQWVFKDDANYIVTINENEMDSGDNYAIYSTEVFKVLNYDEAAGRVELQVISRQDEGEETPVSVDEKMTFTINGDELVIFCEATPESDARETVWVRKE